jgi:hypothetical protein
MDGSSTAKANSCPSIILTSSLWLALYLAFVSIPAYCILPHPYTRNIINIHQSAHQYQSTYKPVREL